MSKPKPTVDEVYFSQALRTPEEQEEYERQFFIRIRLANGTNKNTSPSRLDSLNDYVYPMLRALMPTTGPLRILDVAISNGITTLEWMAQLEQGEIPYLMTGIDLTIEAFLIRHRGFAILVDNRGNVLQIDLPGRSIQKQIFPVTNAIQWVLKQISLLLLKSNFKERLKTQRHVSRYGLNFSYLNLISPRLKGRVDFQCFEADFIARSQLDSAERYHIIRAANILNRSYFNDSQLLAGIRNLKARLCDRGLLIINRTNEYGANNATVFRLNEGGELLPVGRLGKGSEIEHLALTGVPGATS